MRRIIIAVSLLIISAIIGIITNYDLTERSRKHLSFITEIENSVSVNDYIKAENIIKKAADEFNFNDSYIMYNYYTHNDLSEISDLLNTMRIYIKEKNKVEFYHYSNLAKNKLQSVIDKEPVNIRNIL